MIVPSTLSRAFCITVGLLYPGYASFKAIKSYDRKRMIPWMMYWSVFGIFSGFEFILDRIFFWVPFYNEFKMMSILWLVLPQTQGAIKLYLRFIQPYLNEHEENIDKGIIKAEKYGIQMCYNIIYWTYASIQAAIRQMIYAIRTSLSKSDHGQSIFLSSSKSTSTGLESLNQPIPQAPTKKMAWYSPFLYNSSALFKGPVVEENENDTQGVEIEKPLSPFEELEESIPGVTSTSSASKATIGPDMLCNLSDSLSPRVDLVESIMSSKTTARMYSISRLEGIIAQLSDKVEQNLLETSTSMDTTSETESLLNLIHEARSMLTELKKNEGMDKNERKTSHSRASWFTFHKKKD